MAPVGYQEGSEKMWWWKVAMHLDEAQQSLANAMAHNLDDQRPVFALQDKLREGTVILLDILRAKGLMPTAAPNGAAAESEKIVEPELVPIPVMSEPAVPDHMITDAEIVDADPPATSESDNGAPVETAEASPPAASPVDAPIDPPPPDVPAASTAKDEAVS